MKKQIAQYLPVALVLLAFLILISTAGGTDTPAGTDPETTAPAIQTTAPTDSEETQSAPEQTLPADALARVEQALGKHSLDETAMATCIYEGSLDALESTDGFGKDANANALARLCDEQRMNPIAAFWLLTEEALYNSTQDESGTLSVPAFTMPARERKEYAFSTEGVRELLTDLLTVSGTVEDGMQLESSLLGENGTVEASQIFYEEGDCFYAYFVVYGERSAHFLCFYLRGNEKIDDLEFQLLNLRYAKGDEEALEQIDQRGDRQAASLMAAAELVLTGASRVGEGDVPFTYSGSGCGTTIERYNFDGYDETGSLTNYALHLEG